MPLSLMSLHGFLLHARISLSETGSKRCSTRPRRVNAGPNAVINAIGYAEHRSRSHDAVIRVYDDAGNVIETHAHKGDFKEW